MKEYDIVRVVELNQPDRRFDGTDGAKRAPKIGDRGIVHVLLPGEAFIVECVNNEGYYRLAS